MAFELRVTFSGLCMFVRNTRDPSRYAVLMPDARGAGRPLKDNRHGAPHVGYVRLDMANLMPGLPVGDGDAPHASGPLYEAVHRFRRQWLDFGLRDGGAIDTDLQYVPDVSEYAPDTALIPNLFGDAPPSELGFRTILSGGRLEGLRGDKSWTIPPTLNPGGRPFSGHFSGYMVWTRSVDADSLTISVADFDDGTGARATKLEVRPVNGVVEMKVANLCSDNPLEWLDLPIRTTSEDRDFRWFFELLEARGRTPIREILHRAGDVELPFPSEGSRGGDDCIITHIAAEF